MRAVTRATEISTRSTRNGPITAEELLRDAVVTLKASDALDHWQADRDRIEAEELLSWVMDHTDPDPDDVISAPARRRFERAVARRATGEPVPYIIGESEFRELWLDARPGVFVPRDSTEFLAEQAIRRLRRRGDPVAIDLACGSGAVALAIANEVPGADVTGTDLAADAIALGRRNARKLGLDVDFVVGDLFETDLREATVVTHYLGQEVNLRVRPKLLRELQPGARIVSHDYDLGDWAPDATGEVTLANRVHRVYLWRVPPPVERPGALSWSRERVPPSGQWR